jgi:hypothetical protein
MEPLMIGCPACGASTRVPVDQVAQRLAPVCGKCKTRKQETVRRLERVSAARPPA